jgi:hypothetical protein
MSEPLLKILLRNRGLRLVDLARGVGVDKATVTRWAHKEVPPDRINDVVRVTGIPAADLRPDLATVFAAPTTTEGAAS